jgi:hypothetical protein
MHRSLSSCIQAAVQTEHAALVAARTSGASVCDWFFDPLFVGLFDQGTPSNGSVVIGNGVLHFVVPEGPVSKQLQKSPPLHEPSFPKPENVVYASAPQLKGFRVPDKRLNKSEHGPFTRRAKRFWERHESPVTPLSNYASSDYTPSRVYEFGGKLRHNIPIKTSPMSEPLQVLVTPATKVRQ